MLTLLSEPEHEMLRRLSSDIADCHAHAEARTRKAVEATSAQERNDYLRLQQHWLTNSRVVMSLGRV
jgi:hypothetical protein